MQRTRRRFAASRRIVGLVAVVATAIVAACSETSAPTAAISRSDVTPRAAMSRNGQTENGDAQESNISALLRDDALRGPITVTKVISRSGGTVNISATGFQLRVPAGAFDADQMTISVTALAGSVVAYTFEPHGVVFNKPLTFIQHLGHTRLKGKPAPGLLSHLEGAYFPDVGLVDPTTGAAVVTEMLPTSVQPTWTDNVLTFPIHHFSGYLISTGRR